MQNSSYRYLLRPCASFLLTLIASSALFAQSAGVTERVTAEAARHMDLYYRLFSERNMQALPDEVFTIPWMTFGSDELNVFTSREEALVSWQGSLINLLQRGWNRSEFTVENVCVVNEGTAIVSGYNTRYGDDGSEMSVGGVVYFLGRNNGEWRIVGYTSVERGKFVTC